MKVRNDQNLSVLGFPEIPENQRISAVLGNSYNSENPDYPDLGIPELSEIPNMNSRLMEGTVNGLKTAYSTLKKSTLNPFSQEFLKSILGFLGSQFQKSILAQNSAEKSIFKIHLFLTN